MNAPHNNMYHNIELTAPDVRFITKFNMFNYLTNSQNRNDNNKIKSKMRLLKHILLL